MSIQDCPCHSTLGRHKLTLKGWDGHEIGSGVGISVIVVRNQREINKSMQMSPGERSVPLQGEEDVHSRLSLQQ